MLPDSDETLSEPEYCEIFTDRLKLRTLRVSDAAALMPLLSRHEVMRWTSHGVITSLEVAETWTRKRAVGKDVFQFAIEERGTGVEQNSAETPTPIVGLVGTFRPGEIGYMIVPDYAGKGYATEALNSVVPELFSRLPPASEGGVGFDHIEGWTDIQNWPSRRVLEKCGFTLCETIPDPFDNPLRGPSQLIIFRKARPGRTLEELGLIPREEGGVDESAPTSPIQ